MRQGVRDVLARCWNAEKIALKHITSELAEAHRLLRCFHALGHGENSQIARQPDDGADYRLFATLRISKRPHERLINFHDVDRKGVQVRQRGIPGAEVVERYGNAGTLKRVEHRKDAVGIATHQNVFGNFELKAVGRHACMLQLVQQPDVKISPQEVRSSGIDGDPPEIKVLLQPDLDVGQHAVDDPVRAADCELSIVEGCGNTCGRLDTLFRVPPSQQSLHPDQRTGLKADLSLVVREDAVFPQCR